MAETIDTYKQKVQPLLEPVPGASPAGVAAKLEPAYEKVAAEVGKLDMPTGGEVDWKAVVAATSELLTGKTKDVLLASYLAHALHRTAGLDGLARGLVLVSELLERYWDTAFPEVKRLRGRANAVQWFVEKTQQLLPATKLTADDQPVVDAVEAAAMKLVELSKAKFADQAPTFGQFNEAVLRLKQNVPKKAAPPPPPPPAPAAAPAAGAAPSAAAPAGGPAVAMPEAPKGELASPEQAVDFLRGLGSAMVTAGGTLRRANASDPLGYRILRTGLWLHLSNPPPATGGKTTIPAPPEPLRNQLNVMAQNQKWAAVLEEAESALSTKPFWLDPHRLSFQALGGLGSANDRARDAIVVEVRGLLARMPGLPSLTFADGTPFADPQTKTWLDEEVAPKGGGGGGGGAAAGAADPSDAKLAEAKKLLTGGKVGEGLSALQKVIAERGAGRARFVARLELARACVQAGLLAMAKATYDELDREASAHRLDDWEPKLAADCLKGLIAAIRGLSKDPRGAATAEHLSSLYNRLCRLDPAAAQEVWP